MEALDIAQLAVHEKSDRAGDWIDRLAATGPIEALVLRAEILRDDGHTEEGRGRHRARARRLPDEPMAIAQHDARRAVRCLHAGRLVTLARPPDVRPPRPVCDRHAPRRPASLGHPHEVRETAQCPVPRRGRPGGAERRMGTPLACSIDAEHVDRKTGRGGRTSGGRASDEVGVPSTIVRRHVALMLCVAMGSSGRRAMSATQIGPQHSASVASVDRRRDHFSRAPPGFHSMGVGLDGMFSQVREFVLATPPEILECHPRGCHVSRRLLAA